MVKDKFTMKRVLVAQALDTDAWRWEVVIAEVTRPTLNS